MIRGHWEPQTDEEAELLEDIFMVTRHAHNEGVPKARIASLLGFMSASAADTSVYEAEHPARSQPPQNQSEPEPTEDGGGECPNCGEKATNTIASMGLSPVRVSPCGCELTTDEFSPSELKEFIEQVEDDN